MNTPTRKLEDITLQSLVADFERLYVPPGVPADDWGRKIVRESYATGLGVGLMFLKRLESETPERRDAVIKSLQDQIQQMALAASEFPGKSS